MKTRPRDYISQDSQAVMGFQSIPESLNQLIRAVWFFNHSVKSFNQFSHSIWPTSQQSLDLSVKLSFRQISSFCSFPSLYNVSVCFLSVVSGPNVSLSAHHWRLRWQGRFAEHPRQCVPYPCRPLWCQVHTDVLADCVMPGPRHKQHHAQNAGTFAVDTFAPRATHITREFWMW